MNVQKLPLAKVILASQSPRRVEILKQMGVDCEVFPADIDESVLPGETPKKYVQRLAKQKAKTARQLINQKSIELQALPIIAADTTVVLHHEILGKPENDADAAQMLSKLSDTTHRVLTAVAIDFDGQTDVLLSNTKVTMMPMSNTQILSYIATGEHHGKAGSYGIQGSAAAWIKKIEGSYSGVMGLPIYETACLLRKYTFYP
jgi:septum formation protein